MITDLVQIAREIEVLPSPVKERAQKLIRLNEDKIRGVNCAVAARYLMSLSEDLIIPQERYEDFVRFETAPPQADPRLFEVSSPNSGDLIIFRSMFLNEHFGVSLGQEKLFSMLGVYGQGGKWSVDSIEETRTLYGEIAKGGDCDPITKILYLRRIPN